MKVTPQTSRVLSSFSKMNLLVTEKFQTISKLKELDLSQVKSDSFEFYWTIKDKLHSLHTLKLPIMTISLEFMEVFQQWKFPELKTLDMINSYAP